MSEHNNERNHTRRFIENKSEEYNSILANNPEIAQTISKFENAVYQSMFKDLLIVRLMIQDNTVVIVPRFTVLTYRARNRLKAYHGLVVKLFYSLDRHIFNLN